MPTVKEIVTEYLQANGYDGLASSWDCGCALDDLMPCGEGFDDCEPGYRVPCSCGGECDFDFSTEKPEGDDHES